MLAQNRRRRQALVVAVVFLTILLLLSARHHAALSGSAEQSMQWLQGAYKDKTEKVAGLISQPRLRVPTKFAGVDELKVRDDAHKIEKADGFFQHFASIAASKGMTYKEARAGCNWKKDEYVNFMFAADDKWVLKPMSDVEIKGRRKQWQNYMMTRMIPWEEVKDKFSGRGIVIVGGNHNTLERIKVTLRALNTLGSSLPVELHYWDDEITKENKSALNWLYPTGMYFNDLSGSHNIIHPEKAGLKMPSFGFKPAALLNTRFAEPLLLDADNIPVIPPEELYESKTYKEYHSIFWPDISRTRPENPMWALTNTACRMDEYEQESGQLLVDKSRFWYHLQMASWMNNEMGGFFNTYILGDKDMFRFAWHALQTKFGKPARWLASAGTVNSWTENKEKKSTYCGYDFAQHFPDEGTDQVAFMHGGLLKTVHPELLLWNKEKGGIFREFKRAPHDTNATKQVHVHLKWDGAEYFTNRSKLFEVPSCTDMDDVEPRPMNELIPDWEQFFEQVGGYWLLDRPDLKPPY